MIFLNYVAYWCLIINPAGCLFIYIFLGTTVSPCLSTSQEYIFQAKVALRFHTLLLVICLLKLLTSVMKHMELRCSELQKLIISGLLPYLYNAWKILSTRMRESGFSLFLQVWASHEWGNTVNLSDGLLVLPSMGTWRAVSPLQGMLFLLRSSHNSELLWRKQGESE